MKMEGSVRSGGVLKKKSSSGCLIIKRKGEIKNSGALGGFTDNKEKKRPRLAVSYSGSSDEDESLEFIRRKVNNKKVSNGSMGCKRSDLEGRVYDRNNGGMEVGGDRKRSRLDLFEFDEYDEFDGKKMRNEFVEDRFKMVGHSGSGNSKKFGVGSSDRNGVADKRKQGSYFDGSSSVRGKGVDGGVRDKGFELEDEEVHMPISLLRLKYQETANEPIRLQGKNGVLKVMVNKKKNMDLPSQHKNYNQREIEERKGSKSENVVKKDTLARLPFYPSSKIPEARGLFVDKETSVEKVKKEASVEKEKKEAKLEKVKPILTKGSKAKDSVVIRTDTTLKLAPPGGLQASSSKKGAKKEEERFSPPGNGTPVKGKEVQEEKFKRGGSTEKQLLREKIRQMLIDSGWTIDYRPRRNRDYLDAVYINPGGTAYWSIIKAYDALKKQLEEDSSKSKPDVGSPSFAPLSDDLLNKLTRQTKKKIEEEMKRKRKVDGMAKSAKKCAENSDSDQNERRLGPHMKHKSRKGKSPEVDQESGDDLSDECPKRKARKVRVEKSSITSNFNVIQGRTSKIIGRCTLLVRGSDKGENSDSDGYVPYIGKRTVLAWLIDSGSAQLSEKVQYMNRRRTRVLLEGWITRDGIHCGCCSKILTVSKFELHAGSKLRQPFQNIILESGASLLQCQIDAWNRQEESVRRDFHSVDVDADDPDDDTCGICGDGGDLICCDSCPSTFHQICLEIQMLPSGDWHCPNCTCIYCGDTSSHIAGNNDSTVDEPIRCNFCEKKYHRSCSESVYAVPMSSNNVSICGQKCQELYDHIQKILGVKHELEAGFSWSLIQRMEVSDASHRNFSQRVECNSKLAVALSVMNECFLPIFDRRSGINIIHNVVYNCGSNFNRLNFRGFYTAVLERGDEIISAASIRIHGTRLAEMPFIGTREIYRRQGMCRRLLSAIETALVSLGVEKLIIPAISEHMNTWTTVFSFHQLEDVLKKEIKSMNMLVFPGTDMLQKQLIKHEISEGMKAFESKKNQLQLHVPLENPAIDSSMELSKQVENDSGVCHETKIYENVSALDSGSPGSAFPSNDNVAASVSDGLCESDVLLASKGTTVISSEVTNKQKESSSGLKSPPTLDVSSIADTENPLPHSPEKDNTDSSTKTIMSDACKLTSESPCPESFGATTDECSNAAENTGSQNLFTSEGSEVAKVQGSVDSSVKVSEDAEPEINTTDGCVKYMPGSALDSSAQSTNKVNGEPNHASFSATVINEDPDMNQPTVAVPESGLNSCIEPSPDSTAATNAKVTGTGGIVDLSSIRDANDNNKCDLSASCTKVNPEVSGVQIASVEASNEDQNLLTNYTFLDTGESTMRCNPDLDRTTVLDVDNDIVLGAVQKEVVAHTETDKLNGEVKIPPAVDGEFTCPISSHEALAQNTTSSENQPKSS